MNHNADAWMLDCGQGTIAAIGAANMLHVVEDESLCHRIPMAPAHCDRVLVWQKRVLPILDLRLLINASLIKANSNTGDSADSNTAVNQSFCVLGWCRHDDVTEYGVIATTAVPRRIVVTDDKSMAATAEQAASWRSFAVGFFSYHGIAVPILDPATLFGSRQALQGDYLSDVTHRTA